jgi:hypothetical protein
VPEFDKILTENWSFEKNARETLEFRELLEQQDKI